MLALLGRNRVPGVPRALLKSDEHQYGVYSFEAGQAKTAAELTLEDVRRIAELHQGAPGADDAASRQGAAGTDNGDESLALKRSQWRINSGDFGPQNLLLTDAGQVTAVDWEAVGWDDPARLAVGFVAHAASEALTDEARRAFLEVYADRRRLSKMERSRFESVGAQLDLEWAAIYASAMTPR